MFKHIDFKLLAVHIPGFKDSGDKKDFWEAIIAHSKIHRNNNLLILGDFNTGLDIDSEGVSFKHKEFMISLIELGFHDAWRLIHNNKKEFTWYSNKSNGFRLDYGFISNKEVVLNAYHTHKMRLEKITDHSGLIIELDLKSKTE